MYYINLYHVYECVWCFTSSWRLRCWHPHQQHQLRAPWWQPTMVCCHLETIACLQYVAKLMPCAWLSKVYLVTSQPCVGYQVTCPRCSRKRSLDGSDSSKRTGVSGEDGSHVQCHPSTITILRCIVSLYVCLLCFLHIWWYLTRFKTFKIPHVEYQWSDLGRWMMDNCVIVAAIAEQSCWRKNRWSMWSIQPTANTENVCRGWGDRLAMFVVRLLFLHLCLVQGKHLQLLVIHPSGGPLPLSGSFVHFHFLRHHIFHLGQKGLYAGI